MTNLPPQAISQDVLAEKYLAAGEQTEQDLFARIAKALAAVEKPELQAHWQQQFLNNLQRGAIGAGRIMAAAGRVTSHYVKRHRQSKKTGSATLSAVVDLETHPRLMPPARGCVHHFSPDTKHHQRV